MWVLVSSQSTGLTDMQVVFASREQSLNTLLLTPGAAHCCSALSH